MLFKAIKFKMCESRLKDNELCPCGSGMKYGDCCKDKSPKISNSKIPAEVQIMNRMKKTMICCCLHPDKCKCQGKIKNAHALQNNKIISLLAGDDRHVYMLNAKKQPLLVPIENEEIPYVEIHKTSANDATAETCFCSYHDTEVFKLIELGAPDFDPSNEEMKFIYAYKAFIFEHYKQMVSYKVFQECFKDNPAAFQSEDMVAMYRMLQLRKNEFDPIKDFFDARLMSGAYDGIYTCAIKLTRQIQFADYAYIAPDYDLNGNKIKHTQKGQMHRIALTIFPESGHSWLLMSCLESEKRIYERMFMQAEEASKEKIECYLNMTLPLYSENMVLSPLLWNSWDQETQTAYTFFANLNGPDAVRMSMAIGMGLKNMAHGIGKYDNNPKINLFAV